jgi:replicative DNA helicase
VPRATPNGEKYQFSRTFQLKLAAYALTTALPLIETGIVQPHYFEDPFVAVILDRAKSYLSETHPSVTIPILKDLLNQEVSPDEWPHYSYALKKLSQPVSDADQAYVLSAATDFARTQNYKIVLRQAIALLKEGNLDQLDRSLEQATTFAKGAVGGIGSLYFGEVAKRMRRRETPEVIRSFIRGLDTALEDNGYGRQELHLFAALPSTGKSFALDHMAKVSVIQKKKVVLYTLEMSELKVATRLDASFSGVNIRELRENRDHVQSRVEQAGRKYGESLIIKAFPAGVCRVVDLRSHLHTLRMQGFVPDVVIVDYINLMGTGGGRNGTSRHRDLGQVYIDLRGLAQQLNLWLFTAAQSNRGGYDAELLSMKNLAESFEGAMHADTVVTLNRTDEEARRESMRLYLAKDRNGIDKQIITIKTNYAKGAFYRRN